MSVQYKVDTGAPMSALEDIQWACDFWYAACSPDQAYPIFSGGPASVDEYPLNINDGVSSYAWITDEDDWDDFSDGNDHWGAGTKVRTYNPDYWMIVEVETRFNGATWSNWGVGDPETETVDIKTYALHEHGHWLQLLDLDEILSPVCSDCIMFYYNLGWGGEDHYDIGDGDREAYCTMYGGTGVGDLYNFTATPHDGRVLLEWWVPTDSGAHDFRIYASGDGAPHILIHEEHVSTSGDGYFHAWDEDVINGAQYSYASWCDDGWGPQAVCNPSGASPMASYSEAECTEETGGVRVSWETDSESSQLDGFNVYGATDVDYIDTWSLLTGSVIAAQGSPHEYTFLDESAQHGWPHSYLIVALGGSDQERVGPLLNPCGRPYAPNCSIDFAPGQTCPVLCPAGDEPPGSSPPIRIVATVMDSCGFPVAGYDDVRVLLAAGESSDFQLCCAWDEPTVTSSTMMAQVAPTDSEGQAFVDVWWGGGSVQQLEIAAYVGVADQVPGLLNADIRSYDMNGDCVVGLPDFVLFSPWYGSSAPGSWVADFNCDGVVSLPDFTLLSGHYGHECGSTRTLPVPPELLAKLGSGDWSDAATNGFSASPNTPNPFNPITHISYVVPVDGAHVSIVVFDLAGRQIKALVDGDKPAGEHQTAWDGTNEFGQAVPSGVYFYRVEAPGFSDQRKMVLVK